MLTTALKPTTVKQSLADWEKSQGQKCSEAKVIKLLAKYPPIEKMDVSLNKLEACEQLSLSTNAISKIANLAGMRRLRVLSLGRNNISVLTGLEPVSATLTELWVSYNQIEKLKGINVLRNLRVLYMSNNLVKDWHEFKKLTDLKSLKDLLFVGNPLEEAMAQEGSWREEVSRLLPALEKLDGVPIVREEDVGGGGGGSVPSTPLLQHYTQEGVPSTPILLHQYPQEDAGGTPGGRASIDQDLLQVP